MDGWPVHGGWPKALTSPSPSSHLLSKSTTDQAARFRRCGSPDGALPVVMSLALGDLLQAQGGLGGLGREDHFPKARARPTQAPTGLPPFCLMRDLGNGSTGTFDTDQQRARVNERPQAWAPLHSTVQGLAASRVVGSGERNALPVLRLAPRVFRLQMLFYSQVDEPARPCTLLVSTYIADYSTAMDKVHSRGWYGTWSLAGCQAGPPGPFGRPSWGWLMAHGPWA
jgi:hypothetical protein